MTCSTSDAYRAIDRLAAARRAMVALAAQEAALAGRVLALPDGRHAGMAVAVEIVTGPDGARRIIVAEDLLAKGPVDGVPHPSWVEEGQIV